MPKPLLVWTEDYRIGIPALDFEHQELFRQLNDFLEKLAEHEEQAEIEACLGEIHARMEAHFALEEKYMRDNKYPGLAQHKAEHDEFLDEFVYAMARFENDPRPENGVAIENDLKGWVLDHVRSTDKKLAAIAK